MKVICLSMLLLATSAVAYIDGVKPGDDHRRTRGVPGNNRALDRMRSLKGGKGMGGMGTKGCKTLKIKSLDSEIIIEENAVGVTVFYPIYEYYSDEPIGTATTTFTDVFTGPGTQFDCVISTSYNLGFNEDLEFPFEDQIMAAGTCQGSNAIIGGTGQYACASGYYTVVDIEEDNLFVTDFTICNTCA
jgi:hypothetical protein